MFQHAIRTIIPVLARGGADAVAQAPEAFKKKFKMRIPNRDLLVLLKNEFASQQAIEQEVETINDLLMQTESPERFCAAHELVIRNRITTKSKKILRAIRYTELKPFYFLINRN